MLLPRPKARGPRIPNSTCMTRKAKRPARVTLSNRLLAPFSSASAASRMAKGTYSTKFACERIATSSSEGDSGLADADDDELSPRGHLSFKRQIMTRAERRPKYAVSGSAKEPVTATRDQRV